MSLLTCWLHRKSSNWKKLSYLMKCWSFLPYMKLFSIQILRKIGVQAVFINFPVILTCSKKGSSSGHLFSVQFQDWCRTLGTTSTWQVLVLLESCIGEVLSIFLQTSFWRGLLSKAVLEAPPALHTAERRGCLQRVCSLAQLCHH